MTKKKMLYTGKGDDGTSYIFNSKKRIKKDDIIFELLGTLDELNSILGFCKAKSKGFFIEKEKLFDIVEKIQNDLFTIQAEVAKAPYKISKTRINWLEKRISIIESKLPKIDKFIIPGQDEISAIFDYARTIARKVERRAISYEDKLSKNTIAYLNRLSSMLYAIARYVDEVLREDRKHPTYEN